MRRVDCSIIIINYNTSDLILKLLESINQYSTKYAYEIIVIDNSSPNDNPKQISDEFPYVKLVLNSENLGFGRANNQGIELSNGRYILLLNSDTLLIDDVLDKCIHFMDSEFAQSNNIGLMGCKLLNNDMTHQLSTFPPFRVVKYLIYSNVLFSKIISANKKNNDQTSRFVAGISGAFMLFREEVFQKVKPFDPDFFMFSEETELCRERVSKYFNIYYWNEARVIHFGGASSGGKLQLQEMVSYSLVWYKKGIFSYIIYIFSLIINILTELALLIFMKGINRRISLRKVKLFPRLCYYLVFEIPKYPRKWGSRDAPLKVV